MKRQSFMLAGAGALLAGCAAPTAPPPSLTAPGVQPASQGPLGYGTDTQLVGSLLLIPYDFLPKHFLPCHGQLLPIKSNLVLFSLLGTRFGGNGKTDFGLPDMRKREPIKGLSYVIAAQGIYPKRKMLEPNYYGIPPLLGQLSCVAYLANYVPPGGWAKCDGQLMNVEKNFALFSLLGTKFGGDGKTTFALPDLRAHELGKGLTYVIALLGRFPEKG